MFERITPEKAGIESKKLVNLINVLNSKGLNTHSMLMMKDDKVFFETYFKPFSQDYLHRFYSQTKSYVGIAIGLLEEEGKLNLDDPIVKYFPEYFVDRKPNEFLKNQTIRHMLEMRTAKKFENSWFYLDDDDRVSLYFKGQFVRPSGASWEYDSDGSQVLCVLVEKLSGMKLLDYLKEKLFNKMGTFQNAYALSTPTGYTWGDSAFVGTLRDQASFGYLLLKEGNFNGEQLINKDYVRKATSNLVNNNENFYFNHYNYGYGYQIWHLRGNDFMTTGMGDQLTMVFKDKGIIFAIHSSNQGNPLSRDFIIDEVYKVVDSISNSSLEENRHENEELEKLCSSLELRHLDYGVKSNLENKVNGKTFICEENQMGIKEFSLKFDGDKGTFAYENAQGKKEIHFGRGFNVFETFPQEGYSNMVGKEVTKGYFYKCANSGAWIDNERFKLEVEIIDKYLGNLIVYFGFKDNKAFIRMKKNAEYFLREYFGDLVATLKE